MIQAGTHKGSVIPANVVRPQDGIEEAHVAGVGNDARVQQLVVSQRPIGLDPHLLGGFARAGWAPGEFADKTLVNGVLTLKPFVDVLTVAGRLDAFKQGGDGLGLFNVWSGDLMVETVFLGVKAGLHVVDGPTVLDGYDPASGEALAISNPVDFVENRHPGVAGSKKVRVE